MDGWWNQWNASLVICWWSAPRAPWQWRGEGAGAWGPGATIRCHAGLHCNQPAPILTPVPAAYTHHHIGRCFELVQPRQQRVDGSDRIRWLAAAHRCLAAKDGTAGEGV